MASGAATESEADVAAAIHTFLNDASGLYGVTTTAIHSSGHSPSRSPTSLESPAGQPIFFTTADMPTERPSDAFAVWPRASLAERLAPGGVAARQAGHQWVTYVFSMWEHEFRPRLAAARGVDLGQVKIPVMGDMRPMRNDVVHHRGVATSDNSVSARCCAGSPTATTCS